MLQQNVDDGSGHLHRKFIGVAGALLPLLIIIFAARRPTDGLEPGEILGSISAYYYSGGVVIFVGTLAALSAFMLTYKGYRNDLYLVDRGTALLAGFAAGLREHGYAYVERTVAVTTLAILCDLYAGDRTIDFLKIDGEGHEAAVIRGGDWRRWRPRVVLVEATIAPESWEPTLLAADYAPAAFDGLNRYYVRAEDASWLPLLRAPANVLDDFVRFEHVFARWVGAFGAPGDCLIVLSTSGNSDNILRALDAAKVIGMTTIALLGKTGGPALPRADHAVIVPGRTSDRIQELHMLILHSFVEHIEESLPA